MTSCLRCSILQPGVAISLLPWCWSSLSSLSLPIRVALDSDSLVAQTAHGTNKRFSTPTRGVATNLVSVLAPSARNSLLHAQLELVPVVGLEPTRLFKVPGF